MPPLESYLHSLAWSDVLSSKTRERKKEHALFGTSSLVALLIYLFVGGLGEGSHGLMGIFKSFTPTYVLIEIPKGGYQSNW